MTRVVVGALLGVAGLWLSLRDIPPGTLRAALFSARVGWAFTALAVSLVAVLAVVLRWRVLLQPAVVPSSVLGRATLVGQMLNIVLPFRLGEVARVYTATGHSSVGVARLTASLAIEKALDLAIFGVTAAALVTSALLPATSLARGRWLILPATTAVALALFQTFAVTVVVCDTAGLVVWLTVVRVSRPDLRQAAELLRVDTSRQHESRDAERRDEEESFHAGPPQHAEANRKTRAGKIVRKVLEKRWEGPRFRVEGTVTATRRGHASRRCRNGRR